MRFAALTACVALVVAACAAEPAPQPAPPSPSTALNAKFGSSGNDCAVLAAVAREHYKFKPDGRQIWLTLDGPDAGARWQADCNWSKLGNMAYDEGSTPPPELINLPHLSFGPPRYDAEGAMVRTSYTVEPLAGSGYDCRVRSGFAGWTVSDCKLVWVS